MITSAIDIRTKIKDSKIYEVIQNQYYKIKEQDDDDDDETLKEVNNEQAWYDRQFKIKWFIQKVHDQINDEDEMKET